VYRRGKSVANRHVVLCYVMRKTPDLKVGFSVSKKIGKAVVRNKVKRRLKAAFAEQLNHIKHNALIIVIARPGIETLDYTSVKKNLNHVLKKANLFKERS